MRVLLTGAGGFSGRYLAHLLRAQGLELHSVGVRPLSGRHYTIADVTDVAALTDVVTRVRPSFLLHLAGVSTARGPGEYYRVNVGYAAALLEALVRAGRADCATLLVGSAAEYGRVDPGDVPIREDLPPRPYSHYGISKLAQTHVGLAAAATGRPVVVARPFNVLGPGMPEHLVISSMARQLADIAHRRRPPVLEIGNLDSSRDFVSVDDATAAYWALLRTPAARGEVVNVCSGVGTRVAVLLARLMTLAGLDVEVRTDPGRIKTVDIAEHYGDPRRLRQLLGWIPEPVGDAALERIWTHARGAEKPMETEP